jgi:dienelactone hydrolase
MISRIHRARLTVFTSIVIIVEMFSSSITYGQRIPLPDTVEFVSGNLLLKGLFWKPEGLKNPPVILFNHGSELRPHRFIADIAIPLVNEGYAFFLPCRRGQGLSAGTGVYIINQLDSAEKSGGVDARSTLLIKLHETTQLEDQRAALRWLNFRTDIDTARIIVAGVSFGGIQSMLIAREKTNIKAAVNFAGAAMNWEKSAAVANWMKRISEEATIPVYLVQAANDFSTKPSVELNDLMLAKHKEVKMKIYPPQGTKPMDGHTLAYHPSVWMADILPQLKIWMTNRP